MNRLTNVLANGTTVVGPVQLRRALPTDRQPSTATATRASYKYDLDNNLIGLTNQFNGSSVWFTYGYNNVGNRLSLSVNDAGYLYEPTNNANNTYTNNNLNQYSQVNGVTYTYDLNGNLLSDGVNICTYNAENRLTMVVNGSETVTNTYDGLAAESPRPSTASLPRYVYDGDQVIMEYNTSGQALRRYVYGAGIDEPICLFTTNAHYYYHFDGLGSVIALSSGSGAVAEKYTYDAVRQAQSDQFCRQSVPLHGPGIRSGSRLCTITAPGFMPPASGGSCRLIPSAV